MDVELDVPRNGSYFQEWQMLDDENLPIDLTGHTLSADARSVAGEGAVLASATIVLVEANTGRFSMQWDGSDFDAYGDLTVDSRAAFDLKHAHPGGLVVVPVRGQIVLIPEVTV